MQPQRSLFAASVAQDEKNESHEKKFIFFFKKKKTRGAGRAPSELYTSEAHSNACTFRAARSFTARSATRGTVSATYIHIGDTRTRHTSERAKKARRFSHVLKKKRTRRRARLAESVKMRVSYCVSASRPPTPSVSNSTIAHREPSDIVTIVGRP